MADYVDIWHRVVYQDTWTIETSDPKFARLVAPSGWRVASLSRYCGSSVAYVAEFVDADQNCCTYYGSIESINEQAAAALG